MQSIAGKLQAELKLPNVRTCHIGQPGDHADGWDVADAIAQGWSADQVRQFILSAAPFVHPDDAVRATLGCLGSLEHAAAAGRSAAGAGHGGQGDGKPEPLTWWTLLLRSSSGAVKAVRDNVVLALDGQMVKGQHIAGAPECAGVIAFNEFTNNVLKLKATPWGTPEGVWDEVDELEMGNYLTRVHGLPSMPRGTLEEAVAMVAKRHRFHPVRHYFEGLRGEWDGIPRLATWLRRCCLEEDEWDDREPLQRYLALAGTWMMMAIVARVFTPGCKFDYMPILEGGQGLGKSTLCRILGADYFADTGLVLGDKDSYQNLQGVSVYEWGELDSLTRSEITKVKQFISSQKDRFRASFDRRPADYPRQCIFVGTTNEDHYLVDPTGNRRFWPVRVTRHIDLQWLRENRKQLFAEAVERVDAGERFHPDAKEQRELFEPQQQQRQIENAIQAAALRYLYDENAKFAGSIDNGTLVNDITAPELLSRIGIGVDKQTHLLLRQATAALRSAGWERYRSSRGDRPWMFKRPSGEPGRTAGAAPGEPSSTAAAQRPATEESVGVEDDCPF
jgi:predicted P-loop ATPase